MQSLELQATEQISLFKSQQERLEQRQQELALDSDSDDEESAEQNAAANEVREQVRILDDSQVSLAVAFAQLKAARTNQEIGNVLTDKKSLALVGIPESVVGKINQRIGNVSTTDEASAAVGVFDKDVDMRNFFKRALLFRKGASCLRIKSYLLSTVPYCSLQRRRLRPEVSGESQIGPTATCRSKRLFTHRHITDLRITRDRWHASLEFTSGRSALASILRRCTRSRFSKARSTLPLTAWV